MPHLMGSYLSVRLYIVDTELSPLFIYGTKCQLIKTKQICYTDIFILEES